MWFLVTIAAYFILAVVFLADKYLLASSVPNPKTYAFFVGILGIFLIFIIPFINFFIPAPDQIILSLLSGAVFIFGLYWFLKALKNFDASRVVPAVGALVPIFVFAIVFIFSFEREKLTVWVFLSFALLLLGGILITSENKKSITLESFKISALAAFLFALSFVLAKYIYLKQPFLNGLLWTRFGGVLAALGLFFFSKDIKKDIFERKKNTNTGKFGFFIVNQVAGAGAGLLQNWAIALTPLAYLAFINALQGVQYVFLFILTILLSVKFPRILKEEISKKIIFQKIIAILLIGAGLAILAFPLKQLEAKKIIWGVNFSSKHSEDLGLNWRENYLAILDDLGVRNIKLLTYWNLIEKEKGSYDFSDLDWQIQEAAKRNAKIILVIGLKTGRWPECHAPVWAQMQSEKRKAQNSLLEYLKEIVDRYKDEEVIWAWQVENEPFFSFGECPQADADFLKQEIRLVKSLDSFKRPVIISDSGEGSFWFRAAEFGDIIGVTMYKPLNTYISYPLPAVFYRGKAKLIEKIFHKKILVVELQAEPWGPVLLYSLAPKEQEKTMNLEKFKKNISFARETGFDGFYFWGAEWWFWLKEKQQEPEIWQEAKKLFSSQ